MKNILTLFLLHLCLICWAQVPQGITYQALLKNPDGSTKANESVTLTLTLLEGSAQGAIVYEETHNTFTNSSGVVSLVVGEGTVIQGLFSSINWSSGTYFVKIFLDGVDVATSKLLTVPYAFHAKTVEEVEVDYSEISNAPSNLSDFTNDLGILTTADLNDNDASNEIQELSKSGSTVSLSKGGGSFTDEVNDADSDPDNEIQELSISGTSLTLSKGGGSVALPIGGGSVSRTISFPANGLNYSHASSIILNDGNGLRWTNSFSGAASISIRKPADYQGGNVTFHIFFRTTSSTAGTVIFFIRPRSYDSTDGFADASNLSTNSVSVSGTQGFGTLYEQSYSIPASRLGNDWWHISIQRDSNGNTYTDDVIVHSVALEYEGN